MKISCFWQGRALISLSADILTVGSQLILRCLSWTSCHSQCLWILMCWSLVASFIVSLVKRLIVCWLLHEIADLCPEFNCIDLNRHFHQYIFFTVWVRASSSAFIVDVVTVFCFVTCQSTASSKSWNIYSSELHLLAVSLTKTVLLAPMKIFCSFISAENSMARVFML